MDPTPVSQDWNDYGTAVMPRAVTLRKMARFDLHNAVCVLHASMFVSVAYAMEYWCDDKSLADWEAWYCVYL